AHGVGVASALLNCGCNSVTGSVSTIALLLSLNRSSMALWRFGRTSSALRTRPMEKLDQIPLGIAQCGDPQAVVIRRRLDELHPGGREPPIVRVQVVAVQTDQVPVRVRRLA